MLTFHITDLPENQAKTETFLGGTLRIVSHSGLHTTEALLIEHLPRLAAPASLLIAGNRTGAAALAANTLFPACAITCHAFDLHHGRAILRNLAANRMPTTFVHDPYVTVEGPFDSVAATEGGRPATVACTAQIPSAIYDAALFMATPGTMTGELILDQLEDIHQNLALGGTCVIACEADSGPLLKQIKAIFGNHSIRLDKNGLLCVTSVKKGPLERKRDFSAVFPASLPGSEAIQLCSLPGVFCHRRPDNGGLALAEVAAQELQPVTKRLLDMGCGCGIVGILLARRQPTLRVTFIDSHARAMAATQRNLIALGLAGHTLCLCDTGTRQTGFDLFAGNPPYYSDFKIATLFMDTAYEALRRGGTCLLVAKSARRLEESMMEKFYNAEILPRRGYGVVRSLRQKRTVEASN